MSTPFQAADRNLIFGLLALQMDFVSREQLLDAMHAWMLDKHKPLGEILCRRGVLAQDDRDDLGRLVDKHIKRRFPAATSSQHRLDTLDHIRGNRVDVPPAK